MTICENSHPKRPHKTISTNLTVPQPSKDKKFRKVVLLYTIPLIKVLPNFNELCVEPGSHDLRNEIQVGSFMRENVL